MILHFLTEEKFCNYAVKQFSAPSMCSEFVIIDQKGKNSHSADIDIPVINSCSKEFDDLLSSFSKYKAVILHGLFWPWQERVIREIPDNVKVGWVFWGGEIFGRSDIKGQFLSKRSKFICSLHNVSNFIKRKHGNIGFEMPKDLLARIDFCLTDIPEDLDFASKYVGKNFQGLWYNYYSIEQTIGPLAGCTCYGDNVLLGNSATLECNHLDGVKILRKSDVQGKVIVPLSYGAPWVRNIISKLGKIEMGDKFQPLTSFLPLEEYNKLILSCSCVVMPHYRPQAFGNIITSLWLGCRVYLSKRNHLLSFFKRNGFIIFSIEDDLCRYPVLGPLSQEEAEQNRAILRKLYSEDVMRSKNIELINILES